MPKQLLAVIWSWTCCAALAASSVAADDVAGAAARAMLSWMSAQGVVGEVKPRLPAHAIEVPLGVARVEARLPQPDGLRHRMVVWVDVWGVDRSLRSVPVSMEVSVSAAAASPADVATAVPTAFPMPAVRPLEAPVVLRGDWAVLRSGAGFVTLESRVEVLQDGRIGQRVRVRQQGATGIVFGQVTGPGRLELVP